MPFYPTIPGDVQNDPEGVDEHTEPNPDKDEEKIEHDSLIDEMGGMEGDGEGGDE